MGKYFIVTVMTFVLLVASLAQPIAAQTFVHPGIPFTTDDLNKLKAHIAAGDAPWATQYASFSTNYSSSLSYGMNGPFATVSRAPDVNRTAWQNDMTAIFQLSLMWVFTNNVAYAKKATDMLDAWATTNTVISGDECFLAIGDYCEYFVPAADILKATYPGWTAANTAHVKSYFENVIWPDVDVPDPVRPMNQGAIQLKAALSVAAFLDDSTKWNEALNVYRTDAGGGLANSLPNGQVGDAGRDHGHWRGEVQALAWGAEVAWKQGVDLFSELGNRLLNISELYTRYWTNTTGLTYTPFGGPYAYYTGWAGGASTDQMNSHNIIHNAYVTRKGLTCPYTDAMHNTVGDDMNTFLYLKTADISTAVPLSPVIHPSTTWIGNLTNTDVGNVGLAGSVSYNAGTWSLKGAGAELPVPPRDKVDAFNFSYQQITGDATIIASVSSIQNTSDSARAGLMIRESLAPDSKYVGLFMLPNGGLDATWRGATAWNKTNTSWTFLSSRGDQSNGNAGVMPHWMKLERRGTRVALYHSIDSINWSCVSNAEIPMASTAYIGLVVSSHNTSVYNTSVFTNVGITNPTPAGSPVVISLLKAVATLDSSFSYTVLASNIPTSYSASGLPAGLSINGSTGVISGTPTVVGTSFVTINAANSNGTGSAILVVNVANNVAPPAPSNVLTHIVNVYSAGLSWNLVANATTYNVKHSLTAGGPYDLIATNIISNSYIDASAFPGNNYYVVTALSGSLESAPSAEVSISLLPNVPATPTAANSNGQVALTWPTATGASTYNVKRGTVKGTYTQIASGVAGTSYSDEGLTNGTLYYYVVSAVSPFGESANSGATVGMPGASTATWSANPSSSNWDLATNWLEGVAPTSPTELVFDTSIDSTLTNNLSGLTVSKITFNPNAKPYTFGGNSISLASEITNNSSKNQTFNFPINLTNTLDVNPINGNIALGGVMSGIGGINVNNQAGSYVVLSGVNTYSGGTTINGNWNGVWGPSYFFAASGVGTGAIAAPASGPLGIGPVYLKGATLANSGTTVLYNDVYVGNEKLNNFVVSTGGLSIAGRLIGSGDISVEWSSTDYSYLTLSGDNSQYSGQFTSVIRNSTARMTFTSATAGSAQAKWSFNPNFNADNIRFSFSGTMNFGEFAGEGMMKGFSGAPVLSIGALNTDAIYSGTASSILSFTKVGTGTQRFTGVNSYTGATTVTNGTFLVNGAITSPVIVNGGQFGGFGSSTASVTVNAGGALTPGDNGIGAFATTGSLTMLAGSVYSVEFNSNDGTSDKITANGVSLNNATLALTDFGTGPLPLGSSINIVNNTSSTAVTGTFNGLPELAQITVGGNIYVITYKGGDGNDVVLHDKNSAGLPSIVTGLVATPISSQKINLNWAAASASDFVTRYTVKRATTSGGAYTTVATVTSPTYLDSSLVYNTTYYYVVIATNYQGDGAVSAEVNATTLFPAISPAPVSFVAAAGDTKVSLSWNTAYEAVSYNVKRSTVSGGPYTSVASNVTTNTFTDNTATNGSTYYYVVTSVNISGESGNSAEVIAAPSVGGYTYLPFNASSGTVAADAWSTNNATLASSSVTWVPGVSGNGLHFDATSTSYATLPAGVVSTLTDFTISAWVKPDALATWSRVFDFGTGTTNYMFLSVSNGSVPRYAIRTASVAEIGINSNVGLAANAWSNISITQSGTTAIMYINGNEVGRNTSMSLKPSSLGSTTLNYIGKSQWSGDPLLKGTLDEFRIYKRALSASEISSMVSAIAPAAPASLTASNVSNKSSLSWTASPKATGYNVKRATVSGGPYTTIASNVTGTTFVDPATLYGALYYVVTGTSGIYEGPASNEASVVIQPAVPANVIATGWNSHVDLSWGATSGASSYDIVRSTVSGSSYSLLANVASTVSSLTYKDVTAANGTPYYYLIEAKNAAGSTSSAEVSATPVANAIADVWSHADVGAVGIAGNASCSGSVFTLYGTGADVWNQADAFHFVYQPFSATDGAIVARVVSQQNTNTVAKAGVMIRESITLVNSRVALVDRTPNSVLEFIRRTATNTNAVVTSISSGMTTPRWVKLVRSGTTGFTAYQSPDGINWTIDGTTQTISMAASVSIGLANCAANNTTMNTSTFDHVNIATAVPAITSATTGTATVATAFTYTIAASNNPYLYTATGLPAGLTLNADNGVISGIPSVAGTYTIVLQAINAMGAASSSLNLVVAKADQTITFNAINTKTFGDADFALTASASSSLAVSFASSDTSIVTISGSNAHILGAGSASITASQTGNANYHAATPISQILTVNKAPQSINFAALSVKTYGDADFALIAPATSGLAVSFASSDTSIVTISGSNVHIVGAGTANITASQAGGSNFSAATSIVQVLTVNKASQSISFAALSTKTIGDADFVLTASSTSGLGVSFVSSDANVVSISGSNTHIVGVGTANITASQAGSANYIAAVPVVQVLTVQNRNIVWNGSSWSNGTGPGVSDDATIDGDLIAAASLECNNLSINSGRQVVINAGQYVKVNGTLTNNNGVDGILIKAGGNLLHSTDGVQGKAEMDVTGGGITADKTKQWHLVSSPVGSFASSSLFSGIDLYSYNEQGTNSTTSWPAFSGTIVPSQGYLLFSPTATSKLFSGTFNQGNIGLANLSFANAAVAGYNLVGNPYPSTVDWDGMNANQNVSRTIWVWNPSTYSYGTYDGFGGSVNGGSHLIAPCQGFFVQVTSATNQVNFSNSARVTDSKVLLKNGSLLQDAVKLSLSDGKYTDEALVYFSQETAGSPKFFSMMSIPQLYVKDTNTQYAIAHYAAPVNTKDIPLGVKISQTGQYSISVADFSFASEVEVSLEDLKAKKTMDLNSTSIYSFNYVQGESSDRFVLHIHLKLTPTAVSSVQEEESVKIYNSSKQIIISTSLQADGSAAVYDLLGRIIHIQNVNSALTKIDMSNCINGVYLVRYTTNNIVVSKRIAVE